VSVVRVTRRRHRHELMSKFTAWPRVFHVSMCEVYARIFLDCFLFFHLLFLSIYSLWVFFEIISLAVWIGDSVLSVL
jgi:hypothetical protein